jgi:hypothetical protein
LFLFLTGGVIRIIEYPYFAPHKIKFYRKIMVFHGIVGNVNIEEGAKVL